MGGDVWVAGQRRSVREIAAQGGEIPLGPDDYGVITLGPVAFFFQHVKAARKLPRPMLLDMDASVVVSIGLSLFIHISLLVLFFVAAKEMPDRDPLELPTDLITQFLVTPPPEDILEEIQESGTNTEDPGLMDRDETGGKAHEGEEGRVGEEDSPQEDTEIEGEHTTEVSARVRNMGLLGALSGGGEGNAIAAALDVPSVSDIVSGLNSTRTILGRGSGGAGLRGTGSGGGGDGPGSLFGAGDVGTGVGAGRGGGLGRGSGGIGVKGRERTERIVSVQRGTPQVSGYLSPEQINRVVQANQAAIRYCYEVEVQRQPSLRGRVSIQWRINLQGSVTSARVANSTLRNASVEGCMVRQIRRWRFPQPDGGEVVVTYPFIFGVQS
jgi:TonB family protein